MELKPDPELTAISDRYQRRLQMQLDKKYPTFSPFQFFSRVEREFWLGEELYSHFKSLESVEFLEVGAGSGANIAGFFSLGVKPKNLCVNELLPDRAAALLQWLPPEQVFVGDVRSLSSSRRFDVLYLGTVLSSILDDHFQEKLASHLRQLVKPNGLILIYDFVYRNPWNPDVRPMPLRRICELFPGATVTSRRLTLAPPLGRRVGSLYRLFNWPFLRTHRGFCLSDVSVSV